MTKLLLAVVSATALFSVAACSDTDPTTTQSTDPLVEEQAPAGEPDAVQPDATQDDATQPQPVEPAPAN